MGYVSEQDRRKAQKAFARIRTLHGKGLRSLRKHPGRIPWGEIEEEARRLGLIPEMLGKARAFARTAGRGNGYSEPELRELHSLCVEQGFELGVSLLLRLLSVPKARRGALQKRAIAQGWTKGRLDVEIFKRFGNRRPAAGRAWAVPRDLDEAYYRILGVCDRWNRLKKAVLGPDGSGRRKRNKKAAKPLPLPPHIRNLLSRADRALERLKEAAESRLEAGALELPIHFKKGF